MHESKYSANHEVYLRESHYLPSTYTYTVTVLHTTVGPLNVYKKSEGQIM